MPHSGTEINTVPPRNCSDSTVGPACRAGLSPLGEPCRRHRLNNGKVCLTVRHVEVDVITPVAHSGRGKPRSPFRQKGPTRKLLIQPSERSQQDHIRCRTIPLRSEQRQLLPVFRNDLCAELQIMFICRSVRPDTMPHLKLFNRHQPSRWFRRRRSSLHIRRRSRLQQNSCITLQDSRDTEQRQQQTE
jgi:hypothetical protein